MDKLKKLLGKIKLKKGGKFLGFGSSPEADWKVIVSLSIVLIITVIVFDAITFTRVDKREVFFVENPKRNGVEVLSLKSLQEITSYYQEAQIKFEEIINNGDSPIRDPSI